MNRIIIIIGAFFMFMIDDVKLYNESEYYVVIDPAYQCKKNNNNNEKEEMKCDDINHILAFKLSELLNDYGIKNIITRKQGKDISYQERLNIINNNQRNVAVIIDQCYVNKTNEDIISVLYSDAEEVEIMMDKKQDNDKELNIIVDDLLSKSNYEKGKIFAESILKEFLKNDISLVESKGGYDYLLESINVPSIKICICLHNKKGKKFESKNKLIIKCLVNGILGFLKEIK